MRTQRSELNVIVAFSGLRAYAVKRSRVISILIFALSMVPMGVNAVRPAHTSISVHEPFSDTKLDAFVVFRRDGPPGDGMWRDKLSNYSNYYRVSFADCRPKL